MQKPLVSIITPCYNSEKYIAETITSVLEQTYPHWEMLITDDGSTDDSINIINNFIAKDSRIKLFKIHNSGPAVARNNSIKHAKGDYMAFIDSDDIWHTNFIEKSLLECMESEGFVCASYAMKNDKMQEVYPSLIVPNRVNYHDILKTNTISCLTAFVDVKKLGKEYMPNVLYRQDMGLWLQYLKKINDVKGIKEVLAIYRIRKQSHSRNKLKLLLPQWKFYRKTANLSVFLAFYYMIVWSYYGIKKYK